MKKVVKVLQQICRILELVVAVFVLLGIIMAIISLLKDDIKLFEELLNDMTVFRHYLEKIFVLVIGIEFLEMFCHPTVVGETMPYEDFVSVLSIAVLFVLRKYMHSGGKQAKNQTDTGSK